MTLFSSLAEIEELYFKFRNCTLNPDEFHHREHLAVALYICSRNEKDTAKKNFVKYLEGYLTFHRLNSVFHATMTEFWVAVVWHQIQPFQGDELVRLANVMLNNLGDSKLIEQFYSKELLSSSASKEQFIPPDLQPLQPFLDKLSEKFYSGRNSRKGSPINYGVRINPGDEPARMAAKVNADRAGEHLRDLVEDNHGTQHAR